MWADKSYAWGRMLRCYVVTGLLVLAADIILVGAMLGCITPPRKVTKPKPSPIVQGRDALDNQSWHCVEFGLEAKTKRMTYICTNKHDGHRVEVTPIQ